MKRLTIVLAVLMGLFAFISCDEDSGTNNDDKNKDPWIGTWLSAGADVAPLLIGLFNYDSVRVELTDDMVVKTHSHIAGGAWATVEGVYTVTESQNGDVHSVEFVYAAFSQEGIMQVIDASPDSIKLEVVQTLPDIGAVPRTPATGFGSDAALGTANIQKYVKED